MDSQRRQGRHVVRLTCLFVIALTALLAAGCGGGSGSSGAGSSASAVELSVRAGKGTGELGTLTWALPMGEPASLDPSQAADYSPAVVVSNLCDSIQKQKPDTTLEPDAGVMRKLSPTKFVFTLKHGIKFWDGHEATAEDLLFSLEWSARPLSIGSFVYENVKSMKITGPDQVTVTLEKPDSLFEKELGSVVTAPLIEREYTRKDGKKYGTSEGGIMCSGPYELKEWKQGQEIVLTRNEHYWNADYRGHAKTIDIKFLNDTAALAQGLVSGEVDGAYGIPAAIIPQLSQASNGKLYYGETTESLSVSVGYPESPLNEPKLADALNNALNREAIAKVLYHESAAPNYTDVAANSWPPEAEGPWKHAYPFFEKKYAYDPAKAKKLVEEATYHGQQLTIVVPAGDETLSQLAQLIQQEAGQAGLKFRIEPKQPAQFGEMGYTASARQGVDLYISKSFNGIKDPLELLPLILIPGQYYNYTEYDNPKVTHLLEETRQTQSQQMQSELMVDAQAIYERENPGLNPVSLYTITFLNDKLAGAMTDGTYLWLPSLATIGMAG